MQLLGQMLSSPARRPYTMQVTSRGMLNTLIKHRSDTSARLADSYAGLVLRLNDLSVRKAVRRRRKDLMAKECNVPIKMVHFLEGIRDDDDPVLKAALGSKGCRHE